MDAASDQQSTDNQIVARTRAYIVHDRATGKVLHVHYSTTFGHAENGSETPEARALRLSGVEATVKAAVLEVEPTEVSHGRPIKVDLVHQRVVRLSAKPKTKVSSKKKGRAKAPGGKARGRR